MKEKIKKILLWIALIVLVMVFVGCVMEIITGSFGSSNFIFSLLKPLGFVLISYVFFFVLQAFLPAESIYGWVSIFGMSWILLFAIAAGFKRRSKTLQKELKAAAMDVSIEDSEV